MRIVIDPGHGGDRRQGGSSPEGVRGPAGTLEKDVTLDLACRLAREVGPGATLTRKDDISLSVEERARVVKRLGASHFLSLHANQGPKGRRGSEVWVHTLARRSSTDMARAIANSLSRLGQSTSIKAADLALLRPRGLPSDTAACLLEVDFLSDSGGEARLRDPVALDRIAGALAEAVRGLDTTKDSSQAEQVEQVLRNVADSLRRAEGTRFNQVHFDSNRVNFGIGSWTGARIASLLDTYETVAEELGRTADLHAFFGSQAAFESLRQKFRTSGAAAQITQAEQRALESLGADTQLQEAQVRQLAEDVRVAADAIGSTTNPSYPWIDSYMDAISELAAHVLVHARHQHGRFDDLVQAVITAHGGESALGREMVSGALSEADFLREVGEQVVNRVKANLQAGVRRRYADLISRFQNSELSFYFHPRAA